MQYEIRISKRVRNKIFGGKQVFSTREIRHLNIPIGSLVKLVCGREFVAWTTINPLNPRRYIRILSLDEKYDPHDDLVHKLKKALKYRIKIRYFKHYRWVYSESDFLSGIILDKYNDIVVVQISNPFFDRNKEMLIDSILEIFPKLKCIYEKSVGKSRGFEMLPLMEGVLYGDVEPTIIKELGRLFIVDPRVGQKTGFFLDQRENRKIVKMFSSCDKVLDAFCYTGSFGIICAKRAGNVTFVDKNPKAIEILKKNLEINKVDNFIVRKENAFTFMKNEISNRKKYDLIILDPPDLLSEGLNKGLKSIALANQLAIKLLDDGYLATFSCSQDLKIQKFYNMLRAIIRREGKKFEIIATMHQAFDHKVIFPHKELEYLKGFLIHVFR